ncbi:MAG TPA: serine hydrolase domain-containing protein, partial [Limnochordia bacterium]|nr:serine hydrolase domain-containing protein [Limnochordia bacterium]
MTARREAPFEVVDRAVAAGDVPGAVALFGRPEGWSGPRAFGRACLEPEAPMTPATRFDLASLTKVTATLPLALQLIEGGVWRLDEPMANLLPDYLEVRPEEAGRRQAITLRRLLAHTSGIVAWSDLHSGANGYVDTVKKAMQAPLKAEPGERVEYSCLNFILLAEAIRRQLGQTLDQAFAERVAG